MRSVSVRQAEIQDFTRDDDGNQFAKVTFTSSGNEELVRLDELKALKMTELQEPQWKSGDKCRAFYKEKGIECEAVVERIFKNLGTVMVRYIFDPIDPSNGNLAEIPLEDIKKPWKIGDKCRAMDMMNEYEAVIQDIVPDTDGNRFARVKFTDSGNEEVLRLDELRDTKDDQNETDTEKQPSEPSSQPEASSSIKIKESTQRDSSSARTGTVPKKKSQSTSTPDNRYGFVWDPEMVKSNSKQTSKEPSTKDINEAKETKSPIKEGPYECELCAKVIELKEDLVDHMRKHHYITGIQFNRKKQGRNA